MRRVQQVPFPSSVVDASSLGIRALGAPGMHPPFTKKPFTSLAARNERPLVP